MEPLMRIDHEKLPMPAVEEAVAHKLMVVVVKERPVEVVENEEPREEEPRVPPEWVGNPTVQVAVIWRRRVVRDDRRTLTIVIVFHGPRLNVFRTGRRWRCCRIFPFSLRRNGKAFSRREGFERL
jgi:hypothetical protein